MFAKVHERVYDEGVKRVVAICDAELLGEKFSEGGRVLDLKTYRSFYEGDKVDEEKAIELIRSAHNLNVVGKKAVQAVKKARNIDEGCVKTVEGVPLLQLYEV